MVFKLFIDKSRAEEVTATVHERTALIDEIERLVLQESITDKIPGYEDDTIVMLPTDSVECFYVENDKTSRIAQTKDDTSSRKGCMSWKNCFRGTSRK